MRTTRTVKGIKLGFEWMGGSYIDVCIGEAYSQPKEVINVSDTPLEFTKRSLGILVDEWIMDYGRAELAHDVTENWKWY